VNLNVVVTCTKRKTRSPEPHLQLRHLGERDIEERVARWIELVSGSEAQVRAADLYCGDHWSIARSLPHYGERFGHRIRLWVCSAGYGLIADDAPLAPYSATFSSSHPDAVARLEDNRAHRKAFSRWWHGLANWEGPQAGTPRTLRELAESHPAHALVIVASAPYLQALREDIIAAATLLTNTSLLSIVSAGGKSVADIGEYIVPSEARLTAVVGGCMMSLNIRILRALLERSSGMLRPELVRLVAKLAEVVPAYRYPARASLTDQQVRDFITGHLQARPGLTWSALLKALRHESNLACEQKRFRRLFREAEDEAAASNTNEPRRHDVPELG
jgi:hypothetical protein